MRYEYYLKQMQFVMKDDTPGVDDSFEDYSAESGLGISDFNRAEFRYYYKQDLYIMAYQKNMQLLDKIRKDLLND